ncbi:BTB/POZ and TAZ domain-containing protein 4 [Andrographis paniculata]|uniref:BTB/POZ and TAZ domain-containing protein 4 n=1 Tax=Andrographis paniculata TaxID=175694 RepID=UPI0021E86CDA|nr:BTB/POZ and TAZ domain-containing protein 4 [Andrographis paniculata]
MDCKECPTVLEKSMPIPPPLPKFNSRLHHKGLVRTKSNITGENHLSPPAATAGNCLLDRLFDEAYRADVSIQTDGGGVIYAHASILGISSPVFEAMLKRSNRWDRRRRSIPIHGVPPEAVCIFIRYLYSSCYEEENMKEFALPLLVLSHVYAVPKLKQLCEWWLEHKWMTTENAVDIFQLSLLCDSPRLSLMCHRFILSNLKAVCASDGWRDMKESHPVLEKEIRESIIHQEARRKERIRKMNERKIYIQLYEAMEALVHICRDGCRTIGPHDKILQADQAPCQYSACKGLETLIRHFAGCKLRGPGGCSHCKRMWQILELHSRICAEPDTCRVPLCRNFRQKRCKQSKKEEFRWRTLVKKIVRSRSITGAPIFSLGSWDHQPNAN